MTIKELEQQYNEKQKAWKDKIRSKPSRWSRFWSWVWFLIAFPFVWLFYNIRDWRTAICIIVSFLLWSASVWIWYVLAFCSGWTTDAAKWFLGIGSAVWIWWASPVGSPFILLVTFTAIGMKALWGLLRMKARRNHRKKKWKKEKRKMKRIFISQPMLNKTNDEIKAQRAEIVEKLKKKFKKIEVIDSFFENAPHDANPLWFLSKSLQLMSDADVVVFGDNWDQARGCKIEHECAKQYNYAIIYEKDLKK